jgi:glucokinase
MQDSQFQLLADIGGTNARFALYANGEIRDVRVLDGNQYPNVASAIRAYLAQMHAPQPTEAAIAIAGPLDGDLVRLTNSPWQFSAQGLRQDLKLNRLIVLNDFTALAMSLRHLPSHELQQLGGQRVIDDAPIALIGPGTGLGVSGLVPHTGPREKIWIPLQGEGGHVTVAAHTDREIAVLAKLRDRFGHVSAEQVISGPGLVSSYQALCALDEVTPRDMQPSDIADNALNRIDPHCIEALQMFCALLGTVSSNLALTLGARGGVYIGGGIVPRLGDFFAQSQFRSRFDDKGRFRDYLAPIPTYVIHSKTPAFYGLARAFSDPGPRIEG